MKIEMMDRIIEHVYNLNAKRLTRSLERKLYPQLNAVVRMPNARLSIQDKTKKKATRQDRS